MWQLWHYFFYGLLLGWGAAVPIGPLNLEMIRRNLRFGTRAGISLGVGASAADFTYLILLLAGALAILHHEMVLKVIGVLGALILAWFGISALRKPSLSQASVTVELENTLHLQLLKHGIQGYGMTLLNPFTILFWSSVSVQVAALTHHLSEEALYFVATGVILAALSWVIGSNTLLHFTRDRFSPRLVHYLNMMGGIILICFALYGFWHAFQ